MSDLKNSKTKNEPDDLFGEFSDPLAGVEGLGDAGEDPKPKKRTAPPKAEDAAKGDPSARGGAKRGFRKRGSGPKTVGSGSTRILRAEEIKKALEQEAGDDIDVDTVISAYIPMRRTRLFGKELLRLDKMRLLLLAALLLIAIIFILSFMQEQMGNFTINLDRLELYRRGISISADADFTNPTARLSAEPVHDATNIAIGDLPGNLDEIDGDHNGRNYVAYTYYMRNAGKEDVNYYARILLTDCSKGAEKATRVAVWVDGEYELYAAPAADGKPEEGCTNFESEDVVCTFEEDNFQVGEVHKYTVVIWLEGDDPECLDNIVGGSVEFTMSIDTDFENDTTLFVKFVQDIIDTLTGNDPINAAGTESPDFEKYRNVTWDTRKNQ